MNILIVNNGIIPVKLYGGTERVIWYLGSELKKLGHEVSYLVDEGSYSDFAKVLIIDRQKDIVGQIPKGFDLIHFNFTPENLEILKTPYIITIHGNSNDDRVFDLNTIFVSKNHANRYGSEEFVHNGLDWEDYTKPSFDVKRNYFHFIGNARWRIKNVQGAIDIIKKTSSEKLFVLGGQRFNLSMGMRFTLTPKARFFGMVGGKQKDSLLNGSKGLIFPVRWHEPFGLAIIESLFYGTPVFGTPYGSLPEIINSDVGFLSNSQDQLLQKIQDISSYSNIRCHEYALEEFNSKKMTLKYLNYYDKVIKGETINIKKPKLIEIQNNKFLDWNN